MSDSDVTLGRFVFEFLSNTQSLEKGNEQATQSSEELARAIERISISNDNLSRKFAQIVQVMGQTANASEWLAQKQNRAADTNEALTESVVGLTSKFDEFAEAQAEAREEGEKNDKQRDKQGRGISDFTKKLLGLAAAYISVNKIASGFKSNFAGNLEIAKFTELLNINANTVKNWINVLEGAGGSAEDIFETFKNISIQQGEIDVAGTGAPLLQAANKLGVKIKDEFGNNLKPDEILLNFADALTTKNLDKELALYVAGQFGISDDVLRLISRGRGEVEKLLKEQRENQFQFSEGDEEKIQGFNKKLQDLKQTADSLFSEISLDNLESALWLLHQIEETLNILRGKGGEVEFTPKAIGGAFQEFINEQMLKLKNKVESDAEETGEIRKWYGTILDDTLTNKERAAKGLPPTADSDIENSRQAIDLNDPKVSDEEKLRMMMERMDAFNSINRSPLNSPQVALRNSGVTGSSFDFRGMTIQTAATDSREIAADIRQAIKNVVGEEFTKASENLSNSVIG